MRVASTLYEAILDRNVITLRDVYYRDKQLFERQPVVDKIVDDLVATAGLRRRDFYVVRFCRHNIDFQLPLQA